MEAVEQRDGKVDELLGSGGTRLASLIAPGVPLHAISKINVTRLRFVIISVLGLLAEAVQLERLADGQVFDGVDGLVSSPVLEVARQSVSLVRNSFFVSNAWLFSLFVKSREVGSILCVSSFRVDFNFL